MPVSGSALADAVSMFTRSEDIGQIGPEICIGHRPHVRGGDAGDVDGADADLLEQLVVAPEFTAWMDLTGELTFRTGLDLFGEHVEESVN